MLWLPGVLLFIVALIGVTTLVSLQIDFKLPSGIKFSLVPQGYPDA